MALKRIITELGAGADLHGGDMTKAARRAVEDAMRHSSLSLFRGLKLKPEDMRVLVKISSHRAGDVRTSSAMTGTNVIRLPTTFAVPSDGPETIS